MDPVTPTRRPAVAPSSLGALPGRNAAHSPNGRAALRRNSSGTWEPVTHHQFAAEVERLTGGLIAAGVERGDRVVILAPNSYDWTLIDFAVLAAGAVVVPAHPGSSARELDWILRDSRARAVFVAGGADLEAVASIRTELPDLLDVWRMEPDALAELTEGAAELTRAEIRARTAAVQRSDPASVVYTSGTTGRPRGVLLSHGNFLAQADHALARFAEEPAAEVPADQRCTLLAVPLAHNLSRFIEIAAVRGRITWAHSPDPDDLDRVIADLNQVRPTVVSAVPDLIERLLAHAGQQQSASGRLGARVDHALGVAQRWSRAHERGVSLPIALGLARIGYERTVYRGMRAQFGGRLSTLVCGGAPLPDAAAHTLNGVGIPTVQGYGMTEATSAITLATPRRHPIGSVGPPLPGTGLRISSDSEIQVRGGGVFERYWNDAQASAAAFTDDGWLHTGDLGHLDDEGCLWVTGRRHDVITTSTGMQVAPAGIEALIAAQPLVSTAVLVGSGLARPAALIALDPRAVEAFTHQQGNPSLSLAQAAQDPAVVAAVAEQLQQANAGAPTGAQVTGFRILPSPLSRATGHVTASGKVRRDLVLHDFADEVRALYAQERNQER
ncbi:AMP-dependent synthetase/ligase [Dermacoccaceae bacterium W4C1]